MVPGDRLVCAFVEPPAETEFAQWPLHVTIVPWFRTDKSSDDLAAKVEQKLGDMSSFIAKVGEEAGFGYRGRKKVNLIELPSPFEGIEHIVRMQLHEGDAWLVDETTTKRRSFRPHVTMQGTTRLHQGDTFVCDNIYIIEQKGDYKVIGKSIKL